MIKINLTKSPKNEGFTLIELLIVVAIIGILAAVAIPGYIGMQDRGRKSAVIRVAEASVPELQAWMNSAKKAGTNLNLLNEIDTNGDGTISSSIDINNQNMGNPGSNFIVNAANGGWLNLNNNIKNQRSPWAGSEPLWVDGGVRFNIGACKNNAKAGQITICYYPSADGLIQRIFIVVRDVGVSTVGAVAGGQVVYGKIISAD